MKYTTQFNYNEIYKVDVLTKEVNVYTFELNKLIYTKS